MGVSERYPHSLSLTVEREHKLTELRKAGYSIPEIMDVGMNILIKGLKKTTQASKDTTNTEF